MNGLGSMMLFGLDWTYILIIIGLLITAVASSKMKNTFSRYHKERASCGLTGAAVAQKILQANGIYGVVVQPVAGELTDHYNPKDKTLNLSQVVYNDQSIAAIGVAAHECGHAIQDSEEYGPLKFRSSIVPVVNFGSKLAWPLIIVGIILSSTYTRTGNPIGMTIIDIGIVLYSLTVLFQLITLPVEYNASNRALKQLEQLGILNDEEHGKAKAVLGSAALTYVAAASAGILSLLRIILLTGGRGNRRR